MDERGREGQSGRAAGCSSQSPRDGFAASLLQHSLRLAASTPKGSARHVNASSNAALCCLRLGQTSRALKFACRALAMKPQDEYRLLVRECTLEMEHEGRSNSLISMLSRGTINSVIPGEAETVSKLLMQLNDRYEEKAGLQDLAAALEQGGVNAQIAFELLGGYSTIMAYLHTSRCEDAISVLLSAGVCHMYGRQRQGDRAGLLHALKQGDCSGLSGRVRVRWPVFVLEQLLATVLELNVTMSCQPQTHSLTSKRALDLLVVAALDPHQRQVGLAGCGPPPPAQLDMHDSASSSRQSMRNQVPAGCGADGIIDEILTDLVEHVLAACTGASTEAGAADNWQQHMNTDPMGSNSEHSSTLDCLGSQSQCLQLPQEASARSVHGLSTPFAGSAKALPQLQHAVGQLGWLESLPQPSLLQVVRIISSYASSDSKLDRQLFIKAARGNVLPTLLHLYKAIQHSHPTDLDAGGSSTCCKLSDMVLECLLNLSCREPSFIQSEAFTSRQSTDPSRRPPTLGSSTSSSSSSMPSSASSAQRLVLVPTPLLKELVLTAQEALKHCQPCLVPDVAWDGSTKGYKQGWAPADPCPSAPHSSPGQEPASSLLEKWVKLLTAIAVSGKLAARELHRCRVLDFLQEVLDVCGSRPPSLVEAVEAAYGALARQSQAAAQDMFDTSLVTALTGMALHSKQPSLVLVALDRLVPLVTSCSGADYLHVMRPTGLMAAVHQLMLLAARSRAAHDDDRTESGSGASSSGRRPVHPWDAALAAAAEARSQAELGQGLSGLKAGLAPMRVQPVVPDFSLPQTGALKDAAQCILLACLDRSRRQAGLKPMQVPRTGYWALVRPRELQMLERRLREEWASAMLPELPSRSASACVGKPGTEARACWQSPVALKQPMPVTPSAAQRGSSPVLAAEAGTGEEAKHVFVELRKVAKQETKAELVKAEDAGLTSSAQHGIAAAVAQEQEPWASCHSCAPAPAGSEPSNDAAKESSASLRSRRPENLEDTAHIAGRSLPMGHSNRAWIQACKGISADAVLSLPAEQSV